MCAQIILQSHLSDVIIIKIYLLQMKHQGLELNEIMVSIIQFEYDLPAPNRCRLTAPCVYKR
jgi:hypothetical protein